ncbi:MAG: NAD(P)-dependent alcohol dehydrogenase [Alphaproteobacteria bacterium]
MEATAAILRTAAGPFALDSIEIGEPRSDEVIVRIVASGICHTDIKFRDTVPKPIVLGHEGSGIVERIGADVTRLAVGDAVVLTFGFCGKCLACESGAPAHCDDHHALQFKGTRLDGTTALSLNGAPLHGAFFQQSSFATYAVATERNAIRVTGDAPLALLGPLGCGIQTGAGAILNSLKVEHGAKVAVFGAGAVGLSAVMAASLAGADRIVAVDVVPSRLELARELGAHHTVDARDGDVAERVRDLMGGGANYALETAAVESSFAAAIASLASRGVCGFVASPVGRGTTPIVPFDMLIHGKSLRGIVQGSSVPHVFIPRLADLIASERFPLERLVSWYDFADINQAVADAESGVAIKPILRMN